MRVIYVEDNLICIATNYSERSTGFAAGNERLSLVSETDYRIVRRVDGCFRVCRGV